ncbi:MAG: phosphonate metabolism protein/1,5-bisphosphokinase (PRPP-forming) PhnN [Pseudomonadota bacterium]
MAGRLVAVVGPSGAGKDTVIDGARRRLAGDPAIVFVRRVVTRPAGAGGEDHIPATTAEFCAIKAAGGFLLDWEAHGIRYGIPASVAEDVARGLVCVANLSRAAVAHARRLLPTTVVEITAPIPVLAERLARRGRESAADITERLERAGAVAIDADTVIVNDGAIEDAVAALVTTLHA